MRRPILILCTLLLAAPVAAAELPQTPTPGEEWHCTDCMPGWMAVTVLEFMIAGLSGVAAEAPAEYGTVLAVGGPLVAPLMLGYGASIPTTLAVAGGTTALGLYNRHEMDDAKYGWGDVFRRNEVATHLYVVLLGSAFALESIHNDHKKAGTAREAPPVALTIAPDRLLVTANVLF